MALYTGKTADGSDIAEVQGLYISESGTQWSSTPYPINRELNRHLKYNNLNIKEAHEAMLNKKSKASKRLVKYLLANYELINPENK